MKKKIISLLLVCANIFSLSVFAENATNANEATVVVSEVKFKKELEYLVDFGIMNTASDDTMRKPVTQGQFREAIMAILNGNQQEYARIDSFGETYTSDGGVTTMKAIIALVKLLGYDNIAILDAGTYAGYRSVASEYGILDGINKADDEEITYQDAVKMIYNAVNAPVVIGEVKGAGEFQYTMEEDRTALTEKLSIYEATGVVNATSRYAIPGYSLTQDDYIMLGNERFEISKKNMADYFGMNVKVYYEYDKFEDTSTIVRIEPRYSDAVLDLEPREIESFNKAGIYKYALIENGEIGRTKEAKIEEDARYYYNYEYVSTKEQIDKADDFIPETGTVKLIDSDNDDRYEVVIILDYDLRVVQGATEEVIDVQFFENQVKVDDDTIIMDKNGTEFESAAVLLKDDVIQIIFEDDGVTAEYIVVNGSMVSGVINSVGENDGDTIVKVGETTYIIPQKKAEKLKKLSIGKNVTFYLDMNNQIFSFKQNASDDYTYGYMTDIKTYEDEDSGDAVLVLKLFDINEGAIKTYKCVEKVRIDEEVKKPADYLRVVNEKCEWKDSAGNPVPQESLSFYYDGSVMGNLTKWRVWDQLIRFKLNNEGKITRIDFAPNATDYSLENLNIAGDTTGKKDGLYKMAGSYQTDDLKAQDPTRARNQLYAAGNLFNLVMDNEWQPWFIVNNDTIAIFVPGDRTAEEMYRVAKPSSMNITMPCADVFRVEGEGFYPTIMVYYEGNGVPSEGSSGVQNNEAIIGEEAEGYMIADVQEVWNEKEETITHQLTLIGGKKAETVILHTPNEDWVKELSYLKVGNIIKFASSGEKITACKKMLSLDEAKKYDSDEFYSLTHGVFNHGCEVGYCYARYDDMKFYMRNPKNRLSDNWFNVAARPIRNDLPVVEYDVKTGKVEKSDYSCIKYYKETGNIEEASIIYASDAKPNAYALFIINNAFYE